MRQRSTMTPGRSRTVLPTGNGIALRRVALRASWILAAAAWRRAPRAWRWSAGPANRAPACAYRRCMRPVGNGANRQCQSGRPAPDSTGPGPSPCWPRQIPAVGLALPGPTWPACLAHERTLSHPPADRPGPAGASSQARARGARGTAGVPASVGGTAGTVVARMGGTEGTYPGSRYPRYVLYLGIPSADGCCPARAKTVDCRGPARVDGWARMWSAPDVGTPRAAGQSGRTSRSLCSPSRGTARVTGWLERSWDCFSRWSVKPRRSSVGTAGAAKGTNGRSWSLGSEPSRRRFGGLQ